VMVVLSIAAWLSMIVQEVPWAWLKLIGPMTWVLLALAPPSLWLLRSVSAGPRAMKRAECWVYRFRNALAWPPMFRKRPCLRLPRPYAIGSPAPEKVEWGRRKCRKSRASCAASAA
jgi:hypothetical protein